MNAKQWFNAEWPLRPGIAVILSVKAIVQLYYIRCDSTKHSKNKMAASLCFVATLSFAFASTVATSDAEATNIIVPSKLAKANNEFAFTLFKAIGTSNLGRNVVLSPASIWISLGMLYAGADGQTKSQLSSAMHLEGYSSDDAAINNDLKELLHTLNNPSNNYTLSVANRLYGQKGYNFKDEYRSLTEEYLLARLEELDFANDPDGSRISINDWVAEKTLDKVKNLLPDKTISGVTVLVLVNAIYFKGLWSNPFDKNFTKHQTFHLARNNPTSIEMMTMNQQDLNYHNSTDIGCQVLELTYVGGGASMFIFVPHDIEGLSSVEDKLRGESLGRVFGAIKSERVKVSMPKFVFDQGVALKQFLEGIGIVDVFDEMKADLSSIDGTMSLVLTEAVHRAHVTVDEEGTVAAGSTAHVVGMKSGGRKWIDVIADRPFLFLIAEQTTGSILFLGRLMQPPQTGNENIGIFGKTGEQRSWPSSSPINAGAYLSHLLPAMILTVSCFYSVQCF